MTFEDRFCNVALDSNQFIIDSMRGIVIEYGGSHARSYVRGALWTIEEILEYGTISNSSIRILLNKLYNRENMNLYP